MPKPKPFEIATGAEFQQKYPGYFEEVVKNLPPINPEVVPDNLKHLIPYAQQWGIPDCFVRVQFCEAATPEMVVEFKQALANTHHLYEEWSYDHLFSEEEENLSFEQSQTKLSPDEKICSMAFY